MEGTEISFIALFHWRLWTAESRDDATIGGKRGPRLYLQGLISKRACESARTTSNEKKMSCGERGRASQRDEELKS
jgi:hypothetical protein